MVVSYSSSPKATNLQVTSLVLPGNRYLSTKGIKPEAFGVKSSKLDSIAPVGETRFQTARFVMKSTKCSFPMRGDQIRNEKWCRIDLSGIHCHRGDFGFSKRLLQLAPVGSRDLNEALS
jgi:hypothetical protein